MKTFLLTTLPRISWSYDSTENMILKKTEIVAVRLSMLLVILAEWKIK